MVLEARVWNEPACRARARGIVIMQLIHRHRQVTLDIHPGKTKAKGIVATAVSFCHSHGIITAAIILVTGITAVVGERVIWMLIYSSAERIRRKGHSDRTH